MYIYTHIHIYIKKPSIHLLSTYSAAGSAAQMFTLALPSSSTSVLHLPPTQTASNAVFVCSLILCSADFRAHAGQVLYHLSHTPIPPVICFCTSLVPI